MRYLPAIVLVVLTASVCAFNKHPSLSVMGDTGWQRVDSVYDCGFTLCKEILDYSGMTYDFHRHKILMVGGGHATRMWDQVEEFDFETLTWNPLYAPTPCSALSNPDYAYRGEDSSQPGGVLYDGIVRPASRHTYSSLQMLHDTCMLIMVNTQGDKGWCPASQDDWNDSAFAHLKHDDFTWIFDPVAVKWTRLNYTNFGNLIPAVVDPLTGKVYIKNSRSEQVYTYDWKTRTTDTINRMPVGWEGTRPFGYNPVSHSIFYFSKSNIHEYDLSTGQWTTKDPAGTHVDPANRNIPHDTRNNVFGTILNGAFRYYSPATNTWYAVPYDTAQYPANPNFAHTIYDPVDNVYIIVVGTGGSTWETWAYKLSDTPGLFPGTGGTAVENAAGRAPVMAVTASPNPFNATVKIAVSGQRIADSFIEINLFDIKGKMIRKLSANSYQLSAGITWNPSGLSPGLYLVRARIGSRTLERKITLLK